MTNIIHPTAYIAPTAKLGEHNQIGPFVVIDDNVEIGSHCRLGPHAVLQSGVKMGDNNVLHAQVVLGDLPQDVSFKASTPSFLQIGDNNVFREGFTAHRASKEGQATIIGASCYFMNNSHVAHDCRVGDKTIFANNVAIGGFVEVGNNVFMGGNVVAHQFCRIGAFAIVQGTTGLNMDVLPFCLVGGRPARHYRLNTIGLRRAGISGERYKVLEQAFRRLRDKQPLDDLDETAELQILKAWLGVKSKRGLHGFKTLEKGEEQDSD